MTETVQHLTDLIVKLKERGLMGVAIIKQGDAKAQGYTYLATAIDSEGRTCNPRTWDLHLTPDGAIEDLLGSIS